jgi:hypothetical protein
MSDIRSSVTIVRPCYGWSASLWPEEEPNAIDLVVAGPVYQCDFSSHYCSILRDAALPVRLRYSGMEHVPAYSD